MGLKALLVALAVAVSPASYVASHQQSDGGFAEAGSKSSLQLSAWAVLGLVASGQTPGADAQRYLTLAHTSDVSDRELRIIALAALGAGTDSKPDLPIDSSGRIGPLVNSTIWGVLALRASRQPVPRASIRYLLKQQRRSGGWSWYQKGAPDSNDTAAALQALRAAGVKGKPISRGLKYLRGLERNDGGFALVQGRASDSQSTAWAIQAFVAAGKRPPAAAFRFLARMKRPDGSYRYSKRYAVTPVWVTAQVLPALARKPFPLR